MTPEIRLSDGIEIEVLKTDQNTLYYHLKKGDKHLMLTVDVHKSLAVTSLENIPEATREAGATTILYQKAVSIIRDLAKEYNVGIYYRFSSSDEKMQAWLRDPNKGKTIFGDAQIKNTPIGIEAVLEINP